MSFSNIVKDELFSVAPNARHCRIAELSAMVVMCLRQTGDTDGYLLHADSREVMQRISFLCKKLFSEDIGNISEGRTRNGKNYFELKLSQNSFKMLCSTLKLRIQGPVFQNGVDISEQNDDNMYLCEAKVSRVVVRESCCKRAFVRGAFLVGGSITDPEKDYHLEIVTGSDSQADILCSILEDFEIEAKVVARKGNNVVYIKDSEQIAVFLNVMEAHVAMMELENIRILKGVRNDVNRRANCEVANIGKTVAASRRQIEDINFIKEKHGLEKLSEELVYTARLRLEYPEASLSELGRLHEIPVGRSGVNHRLQRLSEIAQALREGKTIE